MARSSRLNPEQEHQLMLDLWTPQIADDPLAFVRYVYPWGVKGTPLEHYSGPRVWQSEDLREIAAHLTEQKAALKCELSPVMFRKATVSGRGTGKSALFAWLIHWFLSTRLGGTVIATANTEAQLKNKLWAEVGRWQALAINSHWFDVGGLSIRPAAWFEERVRQDLKIGTGYYYAQAQLWSEENPDAFAGAHNPLGVMVLMDEASGIPNPIFQVTEGFFTEPVLDRFWLAASNGRRNTGAFFECFHANRNAWRRRHLDSRTVEGTDKALLQSIIDRYGADSDAARTEVYGQFPRRGDNQFIATGVVEDAQRRPIGPDPGAPLIMGVDPARFGDDATVIRFRQGRNARDVPPPVVMRGADNIQVADQCAYLIDKFKPDAVCIDAGNGTGVIDSLRHRGYKVHEVWFGAASGHAEYANKRTELWGHMRDWLTGAAIDASPELAADLCGPEYTFAGRDGDKQILEPKEKMKKRGLASPDHGDALACTFAVRVARKDNPVHRYRGVRIARDVDYPLFSR